MRGRAGLLLAALPLLLACLGLALALVDIVASSSMVDCPRSLQIAVALFLGLPGCLGGLMLKIYFVYWRSKAGETGPGLSRSAS